MGPRVNEVVGLDNACEKMEMGYRDRDRVIMCVSTLVQAVARSGRRHCGHAWAMPRSGHEGEGGVHSMGAGHRASLAERGGVI